MTNSMTETLAFPSAACSDALTEVLRAHARGLLAKAVRLRHNKTRNNAGRKACLAMVYKLCQSAQRGFLRLNGAELIQDVVAGIQYEDGVKKAAT